MQLLRIDWNVVFTIINLIVLYLGLRKFLIGPVTNVMEQRKQMIEGQIADANKLKAEAGDLKKQYEGMLAQAHEESAELLEKTRKSAQAEYENRINVADAEAEKIIENAHNFFNIPDSFSNSRKLYLAFMTVECKEYVNLMTTYSLIYCHKTFTEM